MKRSILFFLYIFLVNTCFGLTYNYYQRNELTGSYQIKNIDDLPEQYRFEYSMQKDKIVGYYYNSSVIKFIDEVDNKRVKKSTYYNKDTGKILYEKLFFYGNDSKIKSFSYRQMNKNEEVVYELKSFFSNKDNNIIYNSSGFMTNGKIEQKVIVDGLLFENYAPSEYKTYGILIDEKNRMSQFFCTEELFSYDGNSVTTKLYQQNKLYKIKRKFTEDGISKYEEIILNAKEEHISSKEYALKGSELKQTMKTNLETINEYEYLKIDDKCYLLSYTDWDKSSVIKIEIPDEVVYIKNQIVENIKYPIDLFEFSIF